MILPPGTAPIHPEFLLPGKNVPDAPDDDAVEGSTSRGGDHRKDDIFESHQKGETSRTKTTKEQKKAQRGSNKGRRFTKVRDESDLCWKFANGSICEHAAECKFSHDVHRYLSAKPPDIRIPQLISNTSPFVPAFEENKNSQRTYPSLDLDTVCPIFSETGDCKYGFKCRYLGGHVHLGESGELSIVRDESRKASAAIFATELNFIGADVQKLLKAKKYPFPIADAYLELLAIASSDTLESLEPESIAIAEPYQEQPVDSPSTYPNIVIEKRTGSFSRAAQIHTPDVPIRFSEKRRLNWTGKTYLAPLTTVGNLPYRRLCVKYGADITCGEMGLAHSFLSGSKEEWSLVRRHPSESIFGVQVAGNKPASLVPTAEILAKECESGIDFVDINCGCPIDLVFKSGSGSALLDNPKKLGKILVGMNKALGEIPVTVKLRTGVKDGKNTAHKLMPKLAAEWGASSLTLHGRTRQQRYTRLADWSYIKDCVDAVRVREADEDLPPIPIFGGGDCFSSQDYWENVEKSNVDGVMIARGALIKPWIFTEVKERREWDISSRERLDIVKTYAEYGLNHFGSDTAGVNMTRRYLCEALSFQYRYIPIGLLENLPGRINDRAPAFRGRDDLETLLASDDSRDWVRISEMFLGPAPATWNFTPKHKSNAYESQG